MSCIALQVTRRSPRCSRRLAALVNATVPKCSRSCGTISLPAMRSLPCREDLIAQLQEGSVTLIDVRPEHEFAIGHLPGALNIPLADLKKRLSKFPKKQEIVAYCRGPYCVLSFEAVALLRAKGFQVRRLEDGFPEWKAAGLEVETAA